MHSKLKINLSKIHRSTFADVKPAVSTILEYSSQEGHLPSSYSHFTYVAKDWPEAIWFRMSQREISIPVGSFRLSI